jgi:hypothetical protein
MQMIAKFPVYFAAGAAVPRRFIAMFSTSVCIAGLLSPSFAGAQVSPSAPIIMVPGTGNYQNQTPPPPAPVDPETAARQAAEAQLTSSLARVAEDSSDWFSLSQAGRAALVLGDARAALGFLARAEALAPRDPVIKAALGAAMVQLEDPQQAIRYFDAAVAMGGLDRAYLGDRGLAFDLMGNQQRAQADYQVAQQSNPSAELTRRYAISLGISGQNERAVQMLGPLLRAQDRAAWRSRAMIVAMNGHADEARQIAQTTMPPQLAQGLTPYFALMDRLNPAQLASAAHFGRFPTYEVVRAQPSRAAGRVEVAVNTATPPRGRDRGTRRADGDGGRSAARPSSRDRGRAVVAAVTPVAAPTAALVPPVSSAPRALAASTPTPVATAPVVTSVQPAAAIQPPVIRVASTPPVAAPATPTSAPVRQIALATVPQPPVTLPSPVPAPALASAPLPAPTAALVPAPVRVAEAVTASSATTVAPPLPTNAAAPVAISRPVEIAALPASTVLPAAIRNVPVLPTIAPTPTAQSVVATAPSLASPTPTPTPAVTPMALPPSAVPGFASVTGVAAPTPPTADMPTNLLPVAPSSVPPAASPQLPATTVVAVATPSAVTPAVPSAIFQPAQVAGPAAAVSNDAPAQNVVASSPDLPPAAVASTEVVASATPTTVVPGWSLADMVGSLPVPEAERAASANALSLAEVEAIAAQRRRAQVAAATEARNRAAAEVREREEAAEQTRVRAAAEAAAREEAETRRRNPARIWVQVATGADVSALGFDCRRLARQYASSFEGQSCASAAWNRTRRLVVGPFRNQGAAREWLNGYSRAGGNGFIWSSDAGEEVSPVGRR